MAVKPNVPQQQYNQSYQMPQQQYNQNYQPQIPQGNPMMASNSSMQPKPPINNAAANANNLKRKKKDPTPTNGTIPQVVGNPLQQQPVKKKQKQ